MVYFLTSFHSNHFYYIPYYDNQVVLQSLRQLHKYNDEIYE